MEKSFQVRERGVSRQAVCLQVEVDKLILNFR